MATDDAPAMTSTRLPRSTWTIILTVVATVLVLRGLGRLWWCACGQAFPITLDAFSPHTSQHWLDPYSVTHVLHGFVFWWILRSLSGRLTANWRITAAVIVESLWEILENTPLIIDRYRQATAALGYAGDSIINSLGDIVCCWLGFLLARRLGLWRSVLVFVVAELLLLFWIRDNLTLNVIMLAWPGEALKQWQLGG